MKEVEIDISPERFPSQFVSDAETKKMVATGLNLNGHLCAELTSIKPLKIKSTYEASCVAYRGGNAQKSYVIDAKKGVAFVP